MSAKTKTTAITLQTKIALGMIVTAVLVVISMAVPNFLGTEASLIEEAKGEALRKLDDLALAIGAVHDVTQGQVNSDMKTMQSEIEKMGAPSLDASRPISMPIVNQVTKEKEQATMPTLSFGDYAVNNDFSFVDRIRELVGGGTVTIFQVLPGKLLRVSTNVMKLDNTRAVGTYIPSNSPVYKAVMNDEVYKGKAYVVNAWYLTAYFPVHAANGDIVAVIYVGRKILNTQVTGILENARVFGSGYSYVFDDKGVMVYHPNAELVAGKKDLASLGVDQAPFLTAKNKILEYELAGSKKLAAVGIFDEKLGWRIGMSIVPDELLARQAKNILTFAAMGGGLGILLALVLTFLLTRFIVRTITHLTNALEGIADGKYQFDIAYTANDALGKAFIATANMAKALEANIAEVEKKTHYAEEEAQRAQQALNEAEEARRQAGEATCKGMNAAADQVESVAERVRGAAHTIADQIEEIANGAEQQREQAATTATAMDQMNATVLEVAQSASLAAEAAEQTRMKAEEGAQVVDKSMNAIGEVSKLAETLKEGMGTLGKQAESIGQVMNVISDIADQTNLLALNAAIEAARAGEAGRGFAVVADEVRKLAEKTMTATREVGEAIAAIQEGTRRNIGRVDQSAKAVDEATALAGESGRALNEIVHLVGATSDQVRSIATASEEQSSASNEIVRAVEDINRISGETADNMQHARDDVSSLVTEADALQDVVDELRKS
ncbi:MAG: methyl-accepting chemotaxis protein [Desulfovibrionaceae bacterium]